MNETKRILIGTVDTGLINDFALGFRELGHHVTTVVSRRLRREVNEQYDADISPQATDLIPWPPWIANQASMTVRVPRGALNRAARLFKLVSLILTHDVFFFQCGGVSLSRDHREYALIRLLGKKIVTAFMGGEARNIYAYQAEYGRESITPELVADCERRMGHDPWGQMRTIRMAERYANVILSQPNQSSLAVRRYSHLFIPLVVDRYKHVVPCRDKPIVVHAPSSRETKGTRWILEAVEQLLRDGVSFEFRLLENVPNDRVKHELINADVLIDQLYFGYYGKLALEAMASGCAVASSNDELREPFPRQRPVWHIDRDNVYKQLKELLTSSQKRFELAVVGRSFVEKYHSHSRVAARILDRLRVDNDSLCEHTPTFLASRYMIEGETAVPRALQALTTEVVRRHGLPVGVIFGDIVAKGLATAIDDAEQLPTWEARGMASSAPGNRCGG